MSENANIHDQPCFEELGAKAEQHEFYDQYTEVIALREEILTGQQTIDADSADVACTLNDLARLQSLAGRYNEANRLYPSVAKQSGVHVLA